MSFVKGKFVICTLMVLSLCSSCISANPIYHGEAKECKKRIALTFDDGPHYKYTEEILDILKNEGVSATFLPWERTWRDFPK
ncbi:MAG: hypothetical protein E7652_00310 [Ruminococcaceae bacterium]|nr:hypothetical protein [Oscillospiraceae bacterium]